MGKDPLPSLGLVDAQTVKNAYGEERGYDAIKKARGRKRNIIVDTIGLLWGLQVHPANQIDSVGGLEALRRIPRTMMIRLQKIIGDSVYRWPMDYFAEKEFNVIVETINRKETGSNMKPWRWVVERTFAWFNHFRRLTRDYERTVRHSEAFIYLAMVHIDLGKLDI